MKPTIQRKIKAILTENIPFKLLALVISILIWLIVVNIENPSQTRTFTATVTVINEEILTEAGQYYTIPDGTATVSFRVTARRSVIEKLTSSDFTATADMAYLDGSKVPVTVSVSSNYSGVTISSKKLYINVEIGEEMTLKQAIEIQTTGQVAGGCIISSLNINTSVVTMTGPQEILSTLESVVATVDVSDATQSFTAEDIVLSFLDSEGNNIDRSSINADVDTVEVTVNILHTKSVEVRYSTSGTTPEGIYLDDITLDVSKINIMGSAEAINSITTVTIPESIINLSEISESTSITVDMSAYLPEGVYIATGSSSQVTVTIEVSGLQTQSYAVPISNISAKNLTDGLVATFEGKTITIEITASKADLSEIKAANITGYVDAEGLSIGTHTLQIILDLDEESYTYSATTATIEIIHEEDEQIEDEEDTEEVSENASEETSEETTADEADLEENEEE